MRIDEIWYQVWIPPTEATPAKTFGFSAVNGIIYDHPDWRWKGKKLLEYKKELIRLRAQVGQIN